MTKTDNTKFLAAHYITFLINEDEKKSFLALALVLFIMSRSTLVSRECSLYLSICRGVSSISHYIFLSIVLHTAPQFLPAVLFASRHIIVHAQDDECAVRL